MGAGLQGGTQTQNWMMWRLKDVVDIMHIHEMKLFRSEVTVRHKDTQSYHNLASWPLTVDCHSHPLVLFAFSSCILYTDINTGVRICDLHLTD